MRLRHWYLIAALLALAGSAAPSISAPKTAPGMVSAADPRAAAAGVEMLREGGTAADAAFATLLALNVVEPQSSGIGGGGYLVYSPRGASPITFDGREKAPHAANGTWFYKNGQPMEFNDAQPGGKSVGVPGNIRMMALAHQRYGKLSWAALFEPAIRLARDGFKVTPRLYNSLLKYPATGALSAQARAIFYEANGQPKPVGTIVRNPAFAVYLDKLARFGPDSFYVGPNAQAIAGAVTNARHNPARMTTGDMASYEAKPRPPLCGKYRRYRICGMGPSSSGGFIVLAALKQLERFNLSGLGPKSPASWHLIAESERLAYADRDKYLADEDFVRVPLAGLTSPLYLERRSALISPRTTIANVEAGMPAGAGPGCAQALQPEHGTSHFVAVDRWGDVASETSTIESSFGSGLMVNGYYLNNELTDFSFIPAKDGCPVANRVEGGKRPRSSMSPTIVYGPDGRVVLAVGAAGGSTIPAQVIKTIIAVLDFRLTPAEAIALPMIYAPGGTLLVESGTFLEADDSSAKSARPCGRADGSSRDVQGECDRVAERQMGRWRGSSKRRDAL